MGVFNRISDIVNSNISSMLDHAENPEKMVSQIARELDTTLMDARTHSARQVVELKRMRSQIDQLESESQTWDRRAEVAINKGREDLAKAALREKSRIDETVSQLEADACALDEAIERLKCDILALEEKRHYVRTRRKALVIRGQTARSRIKVRRELHHTSHEDALMRFERYERKVDQMEVLPASRDLAEEIRALEEEHKLDAELRLLKDRLRGTSA